MFGRERPSRGALHVIDQGRVGCPLRGDVDVETCFTCDHMLDHSQDGRSSYIACRTSQRTDAITRLGWPAKAVS